ncbi:hypothetical protein C0991_000108 [Blastosporella zonata]|nr:hypothetical protein C0991_000108 [Blastosporella zonata]
MPPPAHPSLPPAPHVAYQPFYSSHYAQAYSQSVPQPYVMPSTQSILNFGSNPWCQPGHSRCTYKGCQFTGAPKTLELHMMDRHLIYPPGWGRRPKKPEWDADPSLKGKPIPIQGTNLILDKPEDLEAWLAERKRRWPTSERVEDKKRKMDEAIARGQLPEPSHRGIKRPRTDEGGDNHYERGRGHGRGRGNSSYGRGRATDFGWKGRVGTSTMPTKAQPSKAEALTPASDSSDSENNDEGPETVSSKAPVVSLQPEIPSKPLPNTAQEPQHTFTNQRPSKRPPLQPRKEPHNPFASRPTLLRNLLLPEIRVTISNLSQAIRFLVDNDFLEGVEVTPGSAESKMIQVIANNDVSKAIE